MLFVCKSFTEQENGLEWRRCLQRGPRNFSKLRSFAVDLCQARAARVCCVCPVFTSYVMSTQKRIDRCNCPTAPRTCNQMGPHNISGVAIVPGCRNFMEAPLLCIGVTCGVARALC